MWGPEPTARKEFWCKKVILLKHRDRTCRQKELPEDPEERLVIYCGGEGGKVQGKFPVIFSYAEDLQDPGGLAVVRLRLSF